LQHDELLLLQHDEQLLLQHDELLEELSRESSAEPDRPASQQSGAGKRSDATFTKNNTATCIYKIFIVQQNDFKL
jgi:hypothetical protein